MSLPEHQKLLHPPGITGTIDNGHGQTSTTGTLAAEYRFIHQRMPERTGSQKFFFPTFSLSLQIIFIILFAFFANYESNDEIKKNNDLLNKYPMFQDIQVMVIIGFGFIMTYLKRYGYGSLGFNLLIAAFVIQWSLLARGWIEWNKGNGQFTVNLNKLVVADFTAIAVLISFGVVIGTVTASQLMVMALFEVMAQILNEYLCIHILQAHDVGRSMYVHLFGAVFGLGVSKAINFKSIPTPYKQTSVYHSDLFAFIGTLFLWVFFPSFNAIFAEDEGQTKAVINTFLALTSSTVVTIGMSALMGNGKINAMHVQHATLAGGIAIGSVADLNLQLYVALIIGATGGLFSTVCYRYLSNGGFKFLRLQDTCKNFSLHGIPGLIAALVSAVFAAANILEKSKQAILSIYPGQSPLLNQTEFDKLNITTGQLPPAPGRTPSVQAGYQLLAFATTFSISLFSGVIVGLFLRLPIFDHLTEDIELFDDDVQWITPDDYQLKLTLARTTGETETPLVPLSQGMKSHDSDTGV